MPNISPNVASFIVYYSTTILKYAQLLSFFTSIQLNLNSKDTSLFLFSETMHEVAMLFYYKSTSFHTYTPHLNLENIENIHFTSERLFKIILLDDETVCLGLHSTIFSLMFLETSNKFDEIPCHGSDVELNRSPPTYQKQFSHKLFLSEKGQSMLNIFRVSAYLVVRFKGQNKQLN